MTHQITAITSGENVPSSRFRIRQHIELLKADQFFVSEFYPESDRYTYKDGTLLGYKGEAVRKLFLEMPGVISSYFSDLVWLERTFSPDRTTIERYLKNPKLIDLDDAVWLLHNKPDKLKKLVSDCSGLIAGNSFIADYFSGNSKNCWIVPTAVDTEKWIPAKNQKDKWILGWIGTSGNFKYLYSIEPGLKILFDKYPEIEFLVVSDLEPEFKLINKNVHFEKWSQENEVRLTQTMDCGIMPLEDSEWARGKCAFKMLLYLAVGIPVVVSPFGMNSEVLSQSEVGYSAVEPEEWFERVENLYLNQSLAKSMGENGISLVKKEYSVEVISKKLASIFKHFV